MHSNADAEACITALNGTVIDGKTITVAHVSAGSSFRDSSLTNRPAEDVLEPPPREGTTVSRLTSGVPEATAADTAVVDTVEGTEVVTVCRSPAASV